MTVRELIERLKALDQDAEVFVPAESSAVLHIVEKAREPSPCWTCPPDKDGLPHELLDVGCREGLDQADEPPDGVLL